MLCRGNFEEWHGVIIFPSILFPRNIKLTINSNLKKRQFSILATFNFFSTQYGFVGKIGFKNGFIVYLRLAKNDKTQTTSV